MVDQTVESAVEERRGFVAKLARKNRQFYGTPDGRGILRSLELIFEYRWIYIFELIQNALDARAKSVALQVSDDGDTLVLQHDGTRGFDEPDVEALSKVFRSTKSASSVGFMGIGFKSVFMRFQEARISGWGWTLRYEIARVTGAEYGDVQTDLLGAVVPIWDAGIPLPDPGFTTRFELSRRMDQGPDLESDLARYLPDNDRTPLAILAASGLERLEVNGCVWELGVTEENGGSLEATALSESENRIWQLFTAQFRPSREAIAVFLEHRQIRPTDEERDRVYAEAARPRRILGVLPLDNEGVPAPPQRGRIYATLPTEVTVPFGLHINADWLLNISRGGLRELEDNPWQRGIANGIVEILAKYLQWCSDSLTEPRAAKAAFRALSLPSPDPGGLETLLAQDDWLSRLRNRLAESPVIPVWTTDPGTVGFVKPQDVIVPPDALARAFAANPELQPSILLKGSVLRSDVAGSDATELLRRIDLLAIMRPHHLAHAWEGGLEDWWTTLPNDDEVRRNLLFHVWAAVAKLTSDDAWREVQLACVLSMTEQWLPVTEMTFHKEGLPAEDAPGGPETRRFLRSVVRDTNRMDPRWVAALRQRKRNEAKSVLFSQVWDWVERHANGIGLQDIVNDAVNALAESADPDWSPLLPLGHWAKHVGRPKLLSYVLVESTGDLQGMPVGDALLADPYVEHGQDRRQLFGAVRAIASAYLEEDPKSGAPYEWRVFFEKAGSLGKLAVQEEVRRCDRWHRRHVASFLGRALPVGTTSNKDGYRLLDFDITPRLPALNAPEELRRAVAPWLADGFAALKQKGRRTTSYSYYGQHELVGSTPSAWVKSLSELAWVPCDDGELRRPKDTLPTSDPAREEASVAQLPLELLTVLDEEGLRFGTAIPEATSLQRLLAAGTRLEAEELAELLSDCREQPMTDADRHLFDQALQDLTVPLSDGGRVPVKRIVQRVGGRRRGALGGWIVPLDSITEPLRQELQHPDFPIDFPETTTGGQSMDFILSRWRRALASPEGLANDVRDILPMAYAYCLEDCATDPSLQNRWTAVKCEAMVFAQREWIVLGESDGTYLDDIADRRFIPNDAPVRTVTAGHLGRSREDQMRTAVAMGLPLLSSTVNRDWRFRDVTPASEDWRGRLASIYGLLRRVRKGERPERDGQDSDSGAPPRLLCARELAVDVRVGDNPRQRVPVNARLHEGELTVSGRPVEFGADAAKELLHEFSLGQRADLAADLTGMWSAIDSEGDFRLSVDKFGRSHVPGYESTVVSPEDDTLPGPSNATTDTVQDEEQREAGTGSSPGQTDRSDASDHPDADVAGVPKGTPATVNSTGGSYPIDRALAKQNALVEQLRKSLKGEIVLDGNDHTAEAGNTGGGASGVLGDEEYRKAAIRYEEEANRKPKLGKPHQVGWDIESEDPKNNEVRLIEVKGKGCPWKDDEVVELSRAQVRASFSAKGAQDSGVRVWYLYVVEKRPEGGFRVLPIRSPADTATKWILRGKAWRMVAEGALEGSSADH